VTALGNLSDSAKHAGDAIAVSSFVASMAAWLIANTAIIAAVTALLVAFWTVMRMYESYLTIKIKRRELRE
jgi:hypothetical protein